MLGVKGHDISAISFFENGIERVITTISKGEQIVWSTITNIWKSVAVWKSTDTWKY